MQLQLKKERLELYLLDLRFSQFQMNWEERKVDTEGNGPESYMVRAVQS